MSKKKIVEPQQSCRITADLDPDKWDELNRLAKITGVKKASFIRQAVYRELLRVAQERGV